MGDTIQFFSRGLDTSPASLSALPTSWWKIWNYFSNSLTDYDILYNIKAQKRSSFHYFPFKSQQNIWQIICKIYFDMYMIYELPHDKTNKVIVHPGKSSLTTWRKLGSLTTYSAHSEDSDQTGQMPRLWVFAGRTLILLVLSCRGSYLVGRVTTQKIKIVRIAFNLKCLECRNAQQNQQITCVPSENTDQPVHPCSLIRVFTVRSIGR